MQCIAQTTTLRNYFIEETKGGEGILTSSLRGFFVQIWMEKGNIMTPRQLFNSVCNYGMCCV